MSLAKSLKHLFDKCSSKTENTSEHARAWNQHFYSTFFFQEMFVDTLSEMFTDLSSIRVAVPAPKKKSKNETLSFPRLSLLFPSRREGTATSFQCCVISPTTIKAKMSNCFVTMILLTVRKIKIGALLVWKFLDFKMSTSRGGFYLELPIVIPLLAMLGEVPKSWRDTDSPLQYNQNIFQRQGVGQSQLSMFLFSQLTHR